MLLLSADVARALGEEPFGGFTCPLTAPLDTGDGVERWVIGLVPLVHALVGCDFLLRPRELLAKGLE